MWGFSPSNISPWFIPQYLANWRTWISNRLCVACINVTCTRGLIVGNTPRFYAHNHMWAGARFFLSSIGHEAAVLVSCTPSCVSLAEFNRYALRTGPSQAPLIRSAFFFLQFWWCMEALASRKSLMQNRSSDSVPRNLYLQNLIKDET